MKNKLELSFVLCWKHSGIGAYEALILFTQMRHKIIFLTHILIETLKYLYNKGKYLQMSSGHVCSFVHVIYLLIAAWPTPLSVHPLNGDAITDFLKEGIFCEACVLLQYI